MIIPISYIKSSNIYRVILLGLLLLFLFPFNLYSEGFHRILNEKNGFNHKIIHSIVKDDNNIVWIGTEKGLVKFDGLSFCDFIPSIKGYEKKELNNIIKCGDLLFLKYKNTGCLTYNLNTFEFKELYKGDCIGIQPINETTYFILSINGSLYKYFKSNKTFICKLDLDFNDASLSFFKNLLFIITTKGLYITNPFTNKVKHYNLNIPISKKAHFSTSYNYLYLINNFSVYVIDSISNKQYNHKIYPKKIDIPENVTSFLSFNKKNYFYIHNYRKLIRGTKFLNDDLRTIYNLSTFNGLELKNICCYDELNTLIGTNQGLLWISKYHEGLKQINDNFYFDTILRVRRSILQLNNNELLFFGYPSVVKYNLNSNDFKVLKNGSTYYKSILIKDKIYATTNDLGLICTDKEFKNIEYIYGNNNFHRQYLGLCFDSAKNVIIAGGYNNLVIHNLHNKRNKVFKLNLGLINVIIKDPKKEIYWLGTDKGLFSIDINGNIVFEINNYQPKIKEVLDLLIFNNSELWIAHRKGLHKMLLNSSYEIQKIKINQDIINNSVALQTDNRHRIWIATYTGLIVYNIKTNSYARLLKDINLINSEFNYSSSLKLNDNRLIFGGINGYDIINPNSINDSYINKSPSISTILKISNNDTIQCQVYNKNGIDFKLGEEYLKIYVHVKNKINDFYYDFEYSFDDKIWIKGNSLTQILITDLTPGKHTIKIRSIDSACASDYILLTMNAKLPFYKTTLFAWLIVIIFLLLFILYVVLIRKIKFIRRKVKKQISMDLHDEVGTVLTKALFQSRKSNDVILTNLIENALNSLKVYIYSMSSKNVFVVELVDDVYEMLNFLRIHEQIEVDFNYSNFEDVEISSILYGDLKLSFYEIISNIQKHSHCSQIKFEINHLKSTIKINISDNGVFIDMKSLNLNGNGIENIIKRIKRNKGDINFCVNKLGNGLCIEIIVPLKS